MMTMDLAVVVALVVLGSVEAVESVVGAVVAVIVVGAVVPDIKTQVESIVAGEQAVAVGGWQSWRVYWQHKDC